MVYLFITEGYPTLYVQKYTFLDNLVMTMADMGINCTVCYPVSITHAIMRKEKMPPTKWTKTTDNGNVITVYSPRIITFSCIKIPFVRKLIALLNYKAFEFAVKKTIVKNHLKIDVAYGHFITPSALTAVRVAKENACISCLAYGENSSYTIDELGLGYIRRKLKDLTSVISVSTENQKYLIDNKIVDTQIIKVFPNGINPRIFFPRDIKEMREKYHFPQEVFIVAYVGYFTDIKGSKRLSKALKRLEDVYSIFIGSGRETPDCEHILFQGNLEQIEIGDMISAADVFVLPTIAEGCCNAIIEAMACGLPIISSNQPFNDDILNDECAIRIDTTDVNEIVNAIELVKNDIALRRKMRKAALEKASQLCIYNRAKGIVEWIQECADRKGYSR